MSLFVVTYLVYCGVRNHIFAILFVQTFNLLHEAFITNLHDGSHISLREVIIPQDSDLPLLALSVSWLCLLRIRDRRAWFIL